MLKLYKKIIISILTGILLVLSITPSAMAQAAPGVGATLPPNAKAVNSSDTSTPGPWYNQNFGQWSTKVFDANNPNEIFGERYTYAQVNWIINSLISVIVGQNVTSCMGATSITDPKLTDCLKKFSVANAGESPMLALVSFSNTLLNFRPASGIGYTKNIASNLHLIPQAHAQTGAGYNGISPVISLWSVIRDMSYGLMIIVVIALAFMIMFRAKISPQVVVTVQSALPKVAIALVLITFSYAIAGFLVDAAYVVLGIFAVGVQGLGHGAITTYSSPYQLFNQLNSANGLYSASLGLLIMGILLGIVGVAVLPVAFLGAGVAGPPGWLIGGGLVVSGVLILIFAIIIFFIIFRLFWLILRTACITVLLIIGGPVMILLGVFSGTGGFVRWLRMLAANLAVYPTIVIMVFLSHYFFWGWFLGGGRSVLAGCGSGGNEILGLGSLNTYCINTNVNTVGSIGAGIVHAASTTPLAFTTINLPGINLSTALLGFVFSIIILFLTPRAAHIIEAMIQGKGFDYGSAIGQGMAPVNFARGAVATGVAGSASAAGSAITGGGPPTFGSAAVTGALNALASVIKSK